MCLTTEALALFLNLIGSEIVTADPGVFTIHATEGPVEWVERDNMWCTDAVAHPREANYQIFDDET